ncbi:MAG: hypothetical protein P8016_13435 [Sedimentisphaerales bacterium]
MGAFGATGIPFIMSVVTVLYDLLSGENLIPGFDSIISPFQPYGTFKLYWPSTSVTVEISPGFAVIETPGKGFSPSLIVSDIVSI